MKINASHFKTMEELIRHINMCVREEDIFALERYVGLNELDILVKEIARLNKIIDEIETIFDTPYFDVEVSKQLGDNGFFTFKQMYEACNIVFKKRLKELKEEGKE